MLDRGCGSRHQRAGAATATAAATAATAATATAAATAITAATVTAAATVETRITDTHTCINQALDCLSSFISTANGEL